MLNIFICVENKIKKSKSGLFIFWTPSDLNRKNIWIVYKKWHFFFFTGDGGNNWTSICIRCIDWIRLSKTRERIEEKKIIIIICSCTCARVCVYALKYRIKFEIRTLYQCTIYRNVIENHKVFFFLDKRVEIVFSFIRASVSICIFDNVRSRNRKTRRRHDNKTEIKKKKKTIATHDTKTVKLFWSKKKEKNMSKELYKNDRVFR